jgi:hypothetical protein
MTTDLTLLWAALGAAVAGVLCTLAVQWVSAVRQAARDVGDAAQQISKLAGALVPAARGTERLAGMLGESSGDVQTLQGSVHKLALASTLLTDSLQLVGRWVAIATPLVVAVVDRWSREQAERGDQAGSNDGRGPAQPEAHHPS